MTRLFFGTVLLVAALFTGCGESGPKTYPVKGKVVYPDGSPLKEGTVEFRAKSPEHMNLNARGEIASDGTFELKTEDSPGAVAGEHDVVVIPKAIVQLDSSKPRPPDPIADKYRAYETSGLTATVKESSVNEIELTVTPPMQ